MSTTTLPALVALDLGEQALAALLAWREVDREHGTHTDAGWLALLNLREAADRIGDEGAGL
ncbi:hypothetical protein [Cellulomonas shaoxiangyii]|uniref:Uncharacterized protein n=1 Tax=Cellulomonas shaoxiangyii TaxID=2566013 RepID=A0A4P7SH95_9CELL|nr:hypothetical protein [Cellulomonas shaoxiangyii]QCB93330.1 hypothetical protein E5225_06960 [Cellulomonas shaoxiangyii]TGY79435.1 hypothetical protein E5226_15490 [Cellulomonas shaoxiangyii]